MKITSTEEYGLRCLVQIARRQPGELMSAQDVAEREGISLPYAQKLLRMLSRGDLLHAVRGASGGYMLARAIDEISLGDAVRALGGGLEPEHICERHTGEQDVCCHVGECSIRPVWGNLSLFVMSAFDAIPLALLLRPEQEVSARLAAIFPSEVSMAQPAGRYECLLGEQEVASSD